METYLPEVGDVLYWRKTSTRIKVLHIDRSQPEGWKVDVLSEHGTRTAGLTQAYVTANTRYYWLQTYCTLLGMDKDGLPRAGRVSLIFDGGHVFDRNDTFNGQDLRTLDDARALVRVEA